MSTVQRGTSSYAAASPSTTHLVPLPTGSAAGDLVVLAVNSTSFSASFTLPGTTILNAGANTMSYGLSSVRLTSTDITNGTLTVGISSSLLMTAVAVGYSTAGGVGTPGTVYNKNGTSTPSTQAAQVPSNSGDDVLTFSLIKHSGSAQAYLSSTPSITSLKTSILNGSGVPSSHVGVYTGTPIDVTDTWQTTSTNGVGFQVPVLTTALPDTFFWSYGDPVTSGTPLATKNVTGAATITLANVTVSAGTYTKATYNADSAGSTADYTWNLSILDRYTIRTYILTPTSAWPDTRVPFVYALNGSTYQTSVVLMGSGSPGSIRWARSDGTYVITGPTNLLNFNTIYRVETQVDTVAGTIRGAIFPRGTTIPIYDSGVISASVGSSTNFFKFGRLDSIPSMPDFALSRVKIIHSANSWVGPSPTDPAVGPDLLGVWNGSALDAVEYLGVWNGTSLDAATGFSVT